MCRWARDCRHGTDRRLLRDQGVPVADRASDYEQGGFKNQREPPGDGRQLVACLGLSSVKAPPAPTALPGSINTGRGSQSDVDQHLHLQPVDRRHRQARRGGEHRDKRSDQGSHRTFFGRDRQHALELVRRHLRLSLLVGSSVPHRPPLSRKARSRPRFPTRWIKMSRA